MHDLQNGIIKSDIEIHYPSIIELLKNEKSYELLEDGTWRYSNETPVVTDTSTQLRNAQVQKIEAALKAVKKAKQERSNAMQRAARNTVRNTSSNSSSGNTSGTSSSYEAPKPRIEHLEDEWGWSESDHTDYHSSFVSLTNHTEEFIVEVAQNKWGEKIYKCPECGTSTGTSLEFEHRFDCSNKNKIPKEEGGETKS